MEARQLETEYVPKNIFDLHMENLKDRAKSEKELTDERFEKFQAILEKNLAEYKTLLGGVQSEIGEIKTDLKSEINEVRTDLKSEINEVRTDLKSEINEVRTELKTEINEVRTELKTEINEVRTELTNTKIYLEEKIDHVSDALGIEIDGLEKRMEDMRENQNKWFAVFGVLFTVASIAITVVQFFTGK